MSKLKTKRHLYRVVFVYYKTWNQPASRTIAIKLANAIVDEKTVEWFQRKAWTYHQKHGVGKFLMKKDRTYNSGYVFETDSGIYILE